jgi:hypothetical protein
MEYHHPAFFMPETGPRRCKQHHMLRIWREMAELRAKRYGVLGG